MCQFPGIRPITATEGSVIPSRSCTIGVAPDDAGLGVPHGGHLQAGLGEAGTQGRSGEQINQLNCLKLGRY